MIKFDSGERVAVKFGDGKYLLPIFFIINLLYNCLSGVMVYHISLSAIRFEFNSRLGRIGSVA